MGLIRKVYGILAVQLVLTTIVSAVTVLYTLSMLSLVTVLASFYSFASRHSYCYGHCTLSPEAPCQLDCLGLFTVSLSLLVGVSCANTDDVLPSGSTSTAIYGGISALVFCGYIIYDTDNLIKRFSYDEYILASAALYLDILNLFLSILRVLSQRNN
ncbi:hypothetical protein GH714_002790 [Hevea brasiliensis]|uniref:Uncharacterized protein n=1 Tax=Hevea brasiliensis TaxID=3981 RepID=A0A6A6KIR0_HEVBR|nr:hypothetical protein GH714_002790 [Hevea brasiliensis]